MAEGIDRPRITISDIERSMRGHNIQSIQGKMVFLQTKQPFCEAVASGIGQELLNDLMINMDQLLEKIINENATNGELAEYRVYRKLFKQWSTRIVNYFKIADDLKEIGNGSNRR